MALLNIILFLLILNPIYSVKINLNDYNEWNILELVEKIIPEDPVIVQGGGYDGVDVEAMAHRWQKGRIHAFEPNSSFFQELEGRTKNFFNVKIYPLALSDVSRDNVPFYIARNDVNPRIGSLLKGSEQWKWYYKDAEVVSVNSVSLPDWAARSSVRKIDFLWINTGGNELAVLEASIPLLSDIKVILLETQFQEFRKGNGLYKDVEKFMNLHHFEKIQHWHVPEFQGYALFARKGLVEMIR